MIYGHPTFHRAIEDALRDVASEAHLPDTGPGAASAEPVRRHAVGRTPPATAGLSSG
jgi:hypothetical protein